MKVKTRFIKQTTIALNEKDAEQLLREYRYITEYGQNRDIPMIQHIIGILVGQQEAIASVD